MSKQLPECDWKRMRDLKPELLDALCDRIHEQVAEIISSEVGSPHDKYLKLYRHLKDSDAIVAECFNDWRRSTLWSRLLSMARHDLLDDSIISSLSEETQKVIATLDGLKD